MRRTEGQEKEVLHKKGGERMKKEGEYGTSDIPSVG